MIYLDNAATTYPKPPQVQTAVMKAMKSFGANPGRSGHTMSLKAAEEMYHCRSELADFFHAPGPECVVFTLNCTQAMNMVLKGFLKPGDHVVTSSLEHNAVARPLHALEQKGITYTEAQVVPGDNTATLDAFRKAFQENTKLVVCMHASNVWGIRLPIERITALAHEYGISVAIDCAQTAGILPISMEEYGFDYLCIAAHKGLYAPMGTGILIVRESGNLDTVFEGGTGTNSVSLVQPEELPERFESGTPNMPGIAGIRAGLSFVRSRGIDKIRAHEFALLQELYHFLEEMKGVKLYTELPQDPYYVPVLSFNVENMSSEVVAQHLNQAGIAVRAGLHCSPLAHTFMGTLKQGAVRVCPSVFNNRNEIRMFVAQMRKILVK